MTIKWANSRAILTFAFCIVIDRAGITFLTANMLNHRRIYERSTGNYLVMQYEHVLEGMARREINKLGRQTINELAESLENSHMKKSLPEYHTKSGVSMS